MSGVLGWLGLLNLASDLQGLKVSKPGQDIVSVSYLGNRWLQLLSHCLFSLGILQPFTVLLYEGSLLNVSSGLLWKQMLSNCCPTRALIVSTYVWHETSKMRTGMILRLTGLL